MKRSNVAKAAALALAGVAAGIAPALAGNDGVYDLGEIHVSAPTAPAEQTFDAFGGSTVSNKTMETYGKDSLDKAIDLVPGASSALTGNQRNETDVYIHGFDRWQIPLSIDGVPIYLPADDRLDFTRFLTDDISEVQVAKGYVSVLDGPGGMGGAINLVTRTPVKPLEGEIRTQVDFGDNGEFNGFETYARAGARWDHYYVQASGTFRNVNGFELSDGFNPTAAQGPGRRDWSASRDGSVNLKAGYEPNASDEYSISFLRQQGEKQAPYNAAESLASNKYWTWPYWNVQTLSASTRTAIGSDAYVKTKVYYETFDNAIDMYDNAAQTQQYSTSAEHSVYSDYALGGSIEAGKDFGKTDTLKGALFYRRDNHTQWTQYYVDPYGLNQATTPKSATCMTSATVSYPCYVTPKQVDIEDTYSAALENTYHLTPAIDLVGGVSYDWRRIEQAQDFVLGEAYKGVYYAPTFVNYPTGATGAFNWQGGIVWRYSDAAKLFANVSDRTRFPTLFEMYSTRFGDGASNPNLEPERAANFQIGWTTNYAPHSQFSVSVYYADVSSMIQSVPTGATFTDPVTRKVSPITQYQNVGDGFRYGVDLSIDHYVNSQWTVGGNASAIRSVLTDPAVPGFQLTGFPTLKGMVYANYLPVDSVTITPSLEFANSSWSSLISGSKTTYVATGAYWLANLSAEYRVNKNFSFSAGVRNIMDFNYSPAVGYPAEGRNYFLAAKATF